VGVSNYNFEKDKNKINRIMEGEKLKILMINHHRLFKSIRALSIAEYLTKRGHYVTLLVTADKAKFRLSYKMINGVKVIETPDLLWGKLRSGWDIWNMVRKIFYLLTSSEKFNLIHIFETRPSTIFPTLLYLRRNKIPLVIDWVDWWGGKGGIIDEFRPKWYKYTLGPLEEYFEVHFRPIANGTTVISSALAERAINLGVNPQKILILPPGSRADLFKPMNKEECRVNLSFPNKTPILGFSSLDTHYDIDLVFRALVIVKSKYPDVKLLITGNINQKVISIARQYQVDSALLITGFLPYQELPKYLNCCDIFLVPLPPKNYNIGRWPSKIGDYIGVGRPIVSNPTGDIKRIIETYKIGVLAEPNPEDFAEKIIYLLDNPNVAKELGNNARKLAETELSWNTLIMKLEEFYYKLISES
jgi:glycosyltransferase involved in cell wall biosynthesis